MRISDWSSDVCSSDLLDGKKLGKFDLPDETVARAAVETLRAGSYAVASVEKRETRRNPQPPFTTSTLQQEGSRKLRLSASRTMRIAQRLSAGVDIRRETVALLTHLRQESDRKRRD